MPSSFSIIKTGRFGYWPALLVTVLAGVLWFSPAGRSQTPAQTAAPSPVQDQQDVLRFYTQLVQTDVMVFDKQGRFAKGLKSSDFELKIDGKTKPIEFFEEITAGSVNEETQLAAARGSLSKNAGGKPAGPAPLDRGRPIFFYVDDLHLDQQSVGAARKLITSFINNEMGQNDEAAITSASGQIGFLQQLTDSKSVLRAALERLKYRPYTVRDFENPPMSEYHGLLITRGDRDTTEYFIGQTIKQNPGMTALSAEALVQSRARQLLQQASFVTRNTLTGLEGLVRSAGKLPGRKLVFFVSGGFILDDVSSDSKFRLQKITSAAARSGVVIYSIDARGLVASLADPSVAFSADPSGRLMRGESGELSATQDAMNALAADTGGKATFNTNLLEPSLGQALKRTSTYYLLAWKPDADSPQSSKFRRIEVKLINRPDLSVQVRRGFFDREPDSANAKNEKPSKTNHPKETTTSSETELQNTIRTPYPHRDIPVSLSLTYLNTPTRGPMLTAALQVPNEFFSFAPVNGKQSASVVVAGTIFDNKGNPGGAFSNRLTIDSTAGDRAKPGGDLTYGFPIYLGPGLYQARVGVRDETTGRSGTAHGWIEIPNLAPGELALSSLLLGLRTPPTISNASAAPASIADPVDFIVAHHFSPNGFLRFVLVIYNAAPHAVEGTPDVAIQVQLIRDNQPVVTTALKRVSVVDVADTTRIPYAAEVALNGLPAGRYVLQVVVVDRVTKKSATQRTRFDIE